MRLWHYELIPVLPRKQLLAQWRECCAIASNIANKGTPNHVLVNKVLDYPTIHFISYINEILYEMNRRGYKVNQKSYERCVENLNKGKEHFWNYDGGIVINGNVFPDWHNNRYFIQCCCNLQEKYDCGAISKVEWSKIESCFENKIGYTIYKI